VVQEVTQGFADENLLEPFRERLLAIPCVSDPLPPRYQTGTLLSMAMAAIR
jgi:hypothetical protein